MNVADVMSLVGPLASAAASIVGRLIVLHPDADAKPLWDEFMVAIVDTQARAVVLRQRMAERTAAAHQTIDTP